MLEVQMSVTFDSAKVQAATDKARRTVLKRQGAYLYKVARSKIKRRKKPSSPGMPPHSPTGALKKSIRWASDDKVATIGPVKRAIGMVANLHEFGGTRPYLPEKRRRRNNWKIEIGGHGPIETMPTMRFAKIRTMQQLRRTINIGTAIDPQEMETILMEKQAIAAGKVAVYPPRPFMGPALKDSAPRLAEFWKDSIR